MAGVSSNLYINNLPEGLDDDSFRRIFEHCGTIVSTKYVAQGRYGFVKFSTDEEAQAAISTMDQSSIGGSEITVKVATQKTKGAGKGNDDWNKPQQQHYQDYSQNSYAAAPSAAVEIQSDQVYILGLPPTLTDEGLESLFSGYGQVKWCKMMHQEGRPTSAAMVQFEHAQQADWVVANLDGNIPMGLEDPITVSLKMKKGKGGGSYQNQGYQTQHYGKAPEQHQAQSYNYQPAPRADPYSAPAPAATHYKGGNDDQCNLCVKGLPDSAENLYLYEQFAPHGAISSVRVMRTQKGSLGFVKFTTEEFATQAIKMVNGVAQRDGSVLEVSVKKNKH